MRIILTHEQADFDGIASLLGANLLDELAISVLPRRINRNVRAFLTIYGSELPFVDPRDIGNDKIDVVYLVDTQSLISFKGFHDQTKVHVIDHHSPRKEVPSDWEIRLVETGANTTVFIEAIQEGNISLSVVQATLLLLGIYEDTGSLTYSRTTSRDVRAAAVLLEHGANLAIVSDFLNHPLSVQQQIIYDQLRASSQNHTIQGFNILIAPGDARGIDEELSTIAHKLRDLVDPDAIFLLVNIRGGVQLIARSSNDHIDVSKVAEYFEGGGHPRAAAAIIKSEDRDKILKRLIEILPRYIQPAISVLEIMSRDPQLLAPNTSVREISRQMQRYGFEGYPVVEEGKIIGLVTRRAVDRALSHGLNLTAASLMEAGNISIAPGESIERLQTLMTNSGWGQIPLVDPNTGEILGIVTRTDLLETLAPSYIQSGKRNLGNELVNTLPSERLNLLKEIAKRSQAQRAALYIVGGFVRDLLLGYPISDFDLVVEGDAIKLARTLKEKYGGRISTHQRFGTAKWFIDQVVVDNLFPGLITIKNEDQFPIPETLDFISARREFYTHPTALPTVERGSIKLDLHRRDFTINTLALRLDGSYYGDLYDYWGGYTDIRKGLVRVLHSISFVDDPTRMLRAVRYEQRYGFQIGTRTLELLLEARSLLSRVSGDRIRHELDNIILEEQAVAMFERLHELDLLRIIHPDLSWDPWLKSKISELRHPSYEWNIPLVWKGIPLKRILVYALWLIRKPKCDSDLVVKRIRIPIKIKDIVSEACVLWANLPNIKGQKPSQIAKWLEKSSHISLYCVYLATDQDEIKQWIWSYITDWEKIHPTITGHDLKARGIPPGPNYKIILRKIKDAWIDGDIKTHNQEQELLDQMLQHLQAE